MMLAGRIQIFMSFIRAIRQLTVQFLCVSCIYANAYEYTSLDTYEYTDARVLCALTALQFATVKEHILFCLFRTPIRISPFSSTVCVVLISEFGMKCTTHSDTHIVVILLGWPSLFSTHTFFLQSFGKFFREISIYQNIQLEQLEIAGILVPKVQFCVFSF